jgi:hypothetical protein
MFKLAQEVRPEQLLGDVGEELDIRGCELIGDNAFVRRILCEQSVAFYMVYFLSHQAIHRSRKHSRN